MKNKRMNLKWAVVLFVSIGLAACQPMSKEKKQEVKTLKDAFQGKFYIGAAMNANQILGRDTMAVRILEKQFNSIEPENCLKSGMVQPEQGKFDFSVADKYVEFGEKNHMFVVGHCLVWHSQAPRWFFVDNQGNDVSRDTLIARMKNHIETVVGRYRGRIKGWDVVNEAILDDGSFRPSKFYKIIGKDFIKLAFQFAHEADPDAELYYNDYSLANPKKREGVVRLVKSLQEAGVKIDAVGMQTHIHLNSPSFEEYEKSLLAFASLGVKVNVTEMDLNVLPNAWQNSGA
ncbi:MAG TPA: endo-1,4-beta-xylanase, partial [Sunxiuqinia sp.]|nr:endo-1,4-beta-xylanase [Sunxiuqinia sp.]